MGTTEPELIEHRPSKWQMLIAIAFLGLTVGAWHGWVKTTLITRRPPAVVAPQELQALTNVHLVGQPSAAVGILVFSDFECPVCKTLAVDVLPDVIKKYVTSGVALLAFSDLPLESIHPSALRRSMIAECAARQNAFWSTHDRLFALQSTPTVEQDSVEGLDAGLLQACLSQDAASVIASRSARAASLGIRSTPTLFVGNVVSRGPVPTLKVTDVIVGLTTPSAIGALIERRRSR